MMNLNILKTKLLFLFFLFSSNVFAQWNLSEVATDMTLRNCQSVSMVGEQVYVGSLVGLDPYSLEIEMYHSTNNGTSWGELSSFDGDQALFIREIFFVNENIGYASCSAVSGYTGDPDGSQYVIKTEDGGLNWEVNFAHVSSHPYEFISDIHFFDSNNGILGGSFDISGFAHTSNAWVAITSDGGNSWNNVTLPIPDFTPRTLQSMDIVGDNTVYCVLQDNTVWNEEQSFYVLKSIDKGATWVTISNHLFPDLLCQADGDLYLSDLDFVDENVGWIIFRESKTQSYIYKTEDGGLTWNEVDHPIKKIENLENIDFNAIKFISPTEGFVVGGNYCTDLNCFRGHTIIYTNDGGDNWDILLYSPTNAIALTSIDYDSSTGIGYAVGGGVGLYDGGIFKFVNLNLTESVEIEQPTFSIYPNPSSGEVYVEANHSNLELLSVFSIYGHKVGDYLFNDKRLKLELEKGTYFVKYGDQVRKLIIN